ncbi:MAG: adenylate/guanylate cyclase domain-containing protein [Leptospiraceae bacterium]|nr:adenylate/guanylate cyclase domain-containing protein [Leptospiraceae bacterium]
MEAEARAKLQPAMQELSREHPSHASDIQSLHGWIVNSGAQERQRMNAYRIHGATGIGLETLVRILLWGTQSSIFELHWQQHCPHCNMITAEYNSLALTSGTSHCKMCDVSFTVDFKERVEVSFSLHPSIESIEVPPFCLPPRSLKPLAQLSLVQGEIEEVEFEIKPGVYRYYCPITMSMGRLHVDPASKAEESELHIRQLQDNRFDSTELRISEGLVHLKAENTTVPISGLIVHEDRLSDPIPFQDLDIHLTGLEIIHYPEFREIFGNDALSDREKMTISGVTILFTDITGSTAMYETLGDIQAYNIVRDHFQILIQSIEDRGGIIIKTIGDAVMASFTNTDRALESIFQSLDRFSHYNEEKDTTRQINLKIGLHSGPAILVNLNDRLDYFGGAVNKAARIQGLASSNEIAFSQEILDYPPIRRMLLQRGFKRIYRRYSTLKGLSGSHPVYFLRIGQQDPDSSQNPGRSQEVESSLAGAMQ